MKNLTGKFTFVVPDGHPQAGQKIEKEFDFQQCESEQEALNLAAIRHWSITDLINDVLKQDARSKSYQSAILPYKPSEVTPEEIQERMVRDFIRLGLPEDVARAQVAQAMAQR